MSNLKIKSPLFLGIISFVIYAYLVLLLHPAQNHAFIPERSSLAAAASNVYYGAPMGKVYAGVLNRFFEETSSTEKVLAEAASKSIPPGALLQNTQDGNGIGYMTVADLGFRLFGPHISSIVFMMLLLMGASAWSFLYRFRDQRAGLVPVYFAALTIMLFGPLVWQSYLVIQTPISGIRYFSVAAILPAFHLMLEIADSRDARRWLIPGNFVPIAVQIIVLLTAILIRNSAASTIGAIGTAFLLCGWMMRSERTVLARILQKAAVMAAVGAVFLGILLASLSKGYIAEGRFTETVWHRIFVSMGMHPSWPYGNLRELYDCTKSIPEGLVNGPEDRNGHCVYLVYLKKHNISHEAAGGTYGRTYDVALRSAFFEILWVHPVEVLQTFTVIKARQIYWSLSEGVQLQLKVIPMSYIGLLGLAISIILTLALFPGLPQAPPGSLLSTGGTIGLLAGFSVIPFFAVWAHPQTSADMYTYLFMGAGLLLGAGVDLLRSRLRHS